MPKFVIEREIPGIGSMSPEEMRGAAQKSYDAVGALIPRVQWLESFITTDKVFCLFIAEDEHAVNAHAELSGFPAHRVCRVEAVLDPTTGGV